MKKKTKKQELDTSYNPSGYYRECKKCKELLPVDQEHFYVDKNMRYGFKIVCIECSKADYKRRYEESKLKNKKALTSERKEYMESRAFGGLRKDPEGTTVSKPHNARYKYEGENSPTLPNVPLEDAEFEGLGDYPTETKSLDLVDEAHSFPAKPAPTEPVCALSASPAPTKPETVSIVEGETYFYITSTMWADTRVWSGDRLDVMRLSVGNVFTNLQEALAKAEIVKTLLMK